jgi:deoxyribose-phosphate aldolase
MNNRGFSSGKNLKMKKEEIAGLIDHTLLRPDANHEDIKRLCREAIQYKFYSVCIHPYFIKQAKELLKNSAVRVTTVIGFPLGMTLTEVKVYEAMNAQLMGADELDIVINLGALKSGDWDTVRRDIADVITATTSLVHKTIIETCYLSDDEKRKVVKIALEQGSEFIKTSTGFGPSGAKVRDIKIIKKIVGENAQIKGAGGIKTLKQVLAMLEAGASRIGTSHGVRIMKELSKNRSKL